MKSQVIVLSIALALSGLLIGCGSSRKAESSAVTNTRTTTTGQELLDLEKAHQAGVITDREYARQKKKILNQ